MQSENLLRSDYPLEHNNNLSNSNSPVNTPDHVSAHSLSYFDSFPPAIQQFNTNVIGVHFQESLSGQQSNFFANNDFLGGSKVNDFSSIQGKLQIFAVNRIVFNWITICFGCVLSFIQNRNKIGFLPSHANNSITPDHNAFTNELNSMPNVTMPPSLVGNINEGGHSPNHSTMISSQILGTTPLSQIGCPLPLDPYASEYGFFYYWLCFCQSFFYFNSIYWYLADHLSPCNSSDEGDSEIDSINDDLSSNVSNNSGSKRQKRGILPKQATSVMRAWLFQHLVVGNSRIIVHLIQIILIKYKFLSCSSIPIQLKTKNVRLPLKPIWRCCRCVYAVCWMIHAFHRKHYVTCGCFSG